MFLLDLQNKFRDKFSNNDIVLELFLVISYKITFYFCPIANEMCGEINDEKLFIYERKEMKIVILDCLSKKICEGRKVIFSD